MNARPAMRYRKIVDDFKADSFNQPAEFLDQGAIFLYLIVLPYSWILFDVGDLLISEQRSCECCVCKEL